MTSLETLAYVESVAVAALLAEVNSAILKASLSTSIAPDIMYFFDE